MKQARFIAEARRELLVEVTYYGQARPGWGQKFAAAVEEATALALEFPQAGSPAPANTRTVIVHGFPFSLVYRAELDGILIFALANHSRQPGYWRSRLRDR